MNYLDCRQAGHGPRMPFLRPRSLWGSTRALRFVAASSPTFPCATGPAARSLAALTVLHSTAAVAERLLGTTRFRGRQFRTPQWPMDDRQHLAVRGCRAHATI